ncbi:MAG: hypothetical protein LBH06_01815 [Rikenellaceae bacterium]|jgi:hypothetical protein|nr:hypothetical protein [Rikenellaceae bacterium]
MKTGLFLTIAAIVCSLQHGCNYGDDINKGESGVVRSPNFVQHYIEANDFDVKEIEGIDRYILRIWFKGDDFSSIYKSTDQEKLKELAEYFNDASYNSYLIPNANKALIRPLDEISVSCDSNFDADHDAGQPLDDIVLLCAVSPYEFIESGYKNYIRASEYPVYWAGWANLGGSPGAYTPIDIPLNMVNADNTKMLYPLCYLYFTKTTRQQRRPYFYRQDQYRQQRDEQDCHTHFLIAQGSCGSFSDCSGFMRIVG